MKNPIKLGMIGIGRAGYNMHLKELEGKEDMFKIVAACDVEADRREKMADRFGCKTYYKLDELLSDPEVEVVDIATRSNDHFAHAKTALEAGKTVFLEKPMSMTYKEAEKLVELGYKDGERRLYIRHNRRFEPKFLQVQSIIDSGILGDVYYVKRSVGSFQYRCDWQTLSQYGGGQLLNWGPHIVDQALRFAGGDYTRMFSVISQQTASGDCEDVVRASMVGVNGRHVELLISGSDAITPPEYLVYGTRGALVDIDGEKFKISYQPSDYKNPGYTANPGTPMGDKFGETAPIPFTTEERKWDDGPLDHTWVYLYEAIREGREYPVSNEQALKVMQTIQEIKDQNGR